MATASNRLAVSAWLLLAFLLVLRLPSLVEPAGADQALYTYVGERILAGEMPYRDAWDQKPPGVHLAYAAVLKLWPHQSVIAGADLVVAGLTALALVMLGRRLSSDAGAGELAAALFLFLGNPAFGRLGGVRVRSQCEVFIALAVTLALLAAWRAARGARADRLWLLAAGALVGVAVVFKYNAAAYLVPVVALVALRREDDRSTLTSVSSLTSTIAWLALGVAIPVLLVLSWFAGAGAGALDDLYRATITYNLRYSGETYGGRLQMAKYLLSFPIAYSRVDPLWFVGGLGTLVILGASLWHRLVRPAAPLAPLAPVWIFSACLAIAVNGSRGLPQYFVQAGPALALAAGLAGAWAWARLSWRWRLVLALLLALAVQRVANIPKLVDNTAWDVSYWRGQMTHDEYLSRFGNPDSGDKYSALGVARLASYINTHTDPSDRVLIFGFSPWGYVASDRVSASRFFWSRPVIIGFEQQDPRYGVAGLLAELTRRDPKMVVLQERDWDPDVANSADFFLADPRLSPWLHERYELTDRLHNFQIWTRTAIQ